MNINGGIDWSSHTHHKEFIYPKDVQPINKFVSIIIGNYNHSEETLSLIRRIGDYQEEKVNIEIIVADTGSNKEQMGQLVDGICNLFFIGVLDCAVKLVIIDKSELRKTSPNIHAFAFGINAGVKVSRGDIIISCDSSIITPENFIYEMSIPHLKGKNIFVRAPLWDIKEENIGMIRKEEILNTSYSTLLAHINHKMLKHSMGRPAWSVRRQDFLDLGGFDEEMVYYGVADDDFVTRALMIGYENIMSKSRVIHLWHPEPRNTNEGYNFLLMKKHIQEKKWRVNEDKEWGKYDSIIEF